MLIDHLSHFLVVPLFYLQWYLGLVIQMVDWTIHLLVKIVSLYQQFHLSYTTQTEF